MMCGICNIINVMNNNIVPTVCSHEDTDTCEEEGTTLDENGISCKIIANSSMDVCGM